MKHIDYSYAQIFYPLLHKVYSNQISIKYTQYIHEENHVTSKFHL